MKRLFSEQTQFIVAGITAWFITQAVVEFYNVAWGTGKAVGQFSPSWFILFVVFILVAVTLFMGFTFAMLRPEVFSGLNQRLISYRSRFVLASGVLAIFVLFLPIWFLQRTMWGIVFNGIYIRALIWGFAVFVLSVLLTRDTRLISWKAFLASLILTAGAFTIAVSLQNVTEYPFSLAWSEGNRIWDYSIMFGRERYDIAANQDIFVLLDPGRQFIGGIPFLIPGVTIAGVRLWVGLTLIIPYFLVGLAAFIVADKDTRLWLLMMVWVFLFLRQGPIHTPLVVAAAITVFAWRKPLWVAVPLVIYAGFFAQSSRYTWLFAPGLWIGMLELAGASLRDGKLDRAHWVRAISLGLSGVFGGYLLPKLMPLFNIFTLNEETAISPVDITEQISQTGVTAEFVAEDVANQPYLWYRLLPNPTYGTGILLGLLIAVLPVIIFLVWLAISKKWTLNIWQKLAIVGPLIAFLGVGLVASTKIGGGGDLHNMDMFLIGVAFTVFIAWVNGAKEIVLGGGMPMSMRLVLIAALVIPAIVPWRQVRSFSYGDNIEAIKILTDTPDEKAFDMLPDSATINTALEEIQAEVDYAKEFGDVLFIDQRQLLTFNYIQGVTLIPEYEKKMLMNEALSGHADYFSGFYQNLASQRFSLIITEPLRTPVKDSTYEFGEENNAWVKWVSIPVLCYYEEIQTYKEVNIMLLVPKPVPDDCSQYIPQGN
ncbi:MAG: hypothetical protein J0M11_18030 [Anaerolineae bacterium]|nr:hypothetical protein [Anaerolineae bacterium]